MKRRLGSSHCLHCENSDWPAVLIMIIVAALVAGIMLFAALLALNLIVAGGYINVFIFYANIIAASNREREAEVWLTSSTKYSSTIV